VVEFGEEVSMAFATKQPKPKLTAQAASYEADFYSWTQQQGALLRAGHIDALDRENLAEEIESLGRNEFDKLVSFYRLVLLHMLKWDRQPSKRTRSWAGSIVLHRAHAEQVLKDNPSFRSRHDEALERAYELARIQAAKETGLPLRRFPETCPYSIGDIIDRDFSLDT
jgi:hypothetical protein